MTVLLVLIGVVLTLLYKDVIESLIVSISNILASESPSLEGTIAIENLEYLRLKNIILAASGIIIVALIFSFLLTRLALSPTRKALDAQKQFISNVAHELRTPLSIIKTNTEVLLLDKHIPSDIASTLHSNIEELDRISNITNNLLSLSSFLRPERMEFENVDASRTVIQVLKSLQSLAEQKNIAIHFDRQGDFHLVWANPSGLNQIIMNIIRNAINYTPEGGAVAISVAPTYRGEIELIVEDNGAGIARKDLYRVLEPFYRGDQARSRKGGVGSGLGLSIVSELVKVHRGSMSIESALEKGTKVSIRLPCGSTKKEGKKEDRDEVQFDYS